jgi:hypothetical protein
VKIAASVRVELGHIYLPGRRSHHPNDAPQHTRPNHNYRTGEQGPPLPHAIGAARGGRGDQRLGRWRWEVVGSSAALSHLQRGEHLQHAVYFASLAQWYIARVFCIYSASVDLHIQPWYFVAPLETRFTRRAKTVRAESRLHHRNDKNTKKIQMHIWIHNFFKKWSKHIEIIVQMHHSFTITQ